jgi:hypothetical protein
MAEISTQHSQATVLKLPATTHRDHLEFLERLRFSKEFVDLVARLKYYRPDDDTLHSCIAQATYGRPSESKQTLDPKQPTAKILKFKTPRKAKEQLPQTPEARFERIRRAIETAVQGVKRSDAAAEEVERRRVSRTRLKNLEGSSQTAAKKAEVVRLSQLWQRLMSEHFPDIRVAPWWLSSDGKSKPTKEAGQANTLIKLYSAEIMHKTVQYVFDNWAQVQTKWKNGPPIPTIGYLQVMAPTLTAEAQGAVSGLVQLERAYQAARKAFDTWVSDNPHESFVPPELCDALALARKAYERAKGSPVSK